MSKPEMRPAGTICQILHTLTLGGAEILAARLARRLAGTYRFVFVCLDRLGTLGEELRAEGFPVHVLCQQPGLDWRCALRLARLLRREKVHIVQPHQYTPFFYALMARLLFHRPIVLFTEHGRHYPDFPRRRRILANRLLLERRDRVVSVGNAVRQALVNNEGLAPERIQVIYNGIDLSVFENGTGLRDRVREELQISSESLVLIQVARLDYLRDHATALRSMGQITRHRPDARLLLVGEGPEQAKIEHLIIQHGLEAHVRLLGLRRDVRRLLAAADICLLTSISEGIPLTVIEAMAAGLPVVATRVGGMGEVVEEGITGLLVPPGDAEGLAGNVLRLAGNPVMRTQLGQRGRTRAREVFSESQMHAGYLNLYQEMLRERGS